MDYNVTGAYPRGCPKKRWLDNIKHDLSSLSLNESNVVNRIEWRNAIKPSTCQLISPTPLDRETRTLNGQ